MSDERRTVIRAGRLVDVAAGEVRPAHAIVVRGDRVESVGRDDGRVPAGADVLDLSGYTVLPGLIDCHAHLIGETDTGHGYAGLVQRSGAQEALSGVRNARATLMAGFTTVRDLGTFRAFVDVALRDAIEAGDVLGPRMQCSGAYVTSSSGGGDVTGLAPDVDAVLPRDLRFGVANSADEVRTVVRELIHGGADVIKVIATGAVLTEGTVPGARVLRGRDPRGRRGGRPLRRARRRPRPRRRGHQARDPRRASARSSTARSWTTSRSTCWRETGTYLVADVWFGDWIEEQGRLARLVEGRAPQERGDDRGAAAWGSRRP